jgi:predicted AlkP superfamily pyrophosphatase or phosphodiesterase
MSRKKRSLLTWLLVLLIGGTHLGGQTTGRHKVVVISLDGFPAYALKDPRLPVPMLRRLMREGSFAESMRPVNPTVTWPNHTTMVTGVNASVHQVLFNGQVIPPAGGKAPYVDARRSKDEMVHAPTVYDEAYEAGLSTAQVDWVAINHAKTITWQFPERPDPEGPIEKELIANGQVSADQLRSFEEGSQAWQDQMWTDAAIQILKEHKPDLLLLHLLSLDTENHDYGPGGEASMTAVAFLDDCVSRVVDALRNSGQLQNTVVLVVSDHGFRKVSHALHPQVLLNTPAPLKGRVWVLAEGGTASIYFDTTTDTRLIEEVEKLYANEEGVDRIYHPEEFARLGWPTKQQSKEAPDLILTAKPGYYFSGGKSDIFVSGPEENGNHGYLNTDREMQAIFIAWGDSIRRGNNLGDISILEVEPVIAQLLGLRKRDTSDKLMSRLSEDP